MPTSPRPTSSIATSARRCARPAAWSGGGNIPYKAMWRALDWAVEHGCHTVEALNATIREGRLGELIAASEARYEGEIEQAAQAILERRDELKFIIVAGPSSSGKTTTTHKLTQRLAAAGVEAVPLALDNYFFDLDLHPGDEFGDRDFETPEALDLVLINRHLAEIDAGRAIEMPVYDFKTGRRVERTQRFEAPAGEPDRPRHPARPVRRPDGERTRPPQVPALHRDHQSAQGRCRPLRALDRSAHAASHGPRLGVPRLRPGAHDPPLALRPPRRAQAHHRPPGPRPTST